MHAELFSANHAILWDEIVRSAPQATLLHHRGFIDYHAQRFCDCSLLFFDDAGRAVGALPAHMTEVNGDQRICSHGGLTFGGLLTRPGLHSVEVGRMLRTAASFYAERGATSLTYKPIPHIYHRQGAEADLYWLWRAGAVLTARSLSSAVVLKHPQPFSTLRKRKVKKAETEAHLRVRKVESDNDLTNFHALLSQILRTRHGVRPVHSLGELQLLHRRFPREIELYITETPAGTLEGGTLVFVSPRVVHAQYIAASESGRACGALDFLFHHLIYNKEWAVDTDYFDFGISTEQGGLLLNEGLLFQKEGLGGRPVAYDTYEVSLTNLLALPL